MTQQERECLWCAQLRKSDCCNAPVRYTEDGWLVCTSCNQETGVSCDCEEEAEHRLSLKGLRDRHGGAYGGDGPDD